ncbi:WD40-repeat-containing domain protein [Halteromyces radiatus]|uniref:WD40-repeat-containing domain protein n=1 Tax=Halteromyces radiatus TaxID=101107 RepID=UPI00221F1626|nr:WD40-repeat-containing domain protein [Halteromyces radiatus]KAI8098654.1 WD40-repeat-containing domain protein [Halteromyces radiatus]
MTIFNKFSNIAHKAKEHALSKSILSKDKRLDHSLSSIIRTDMIHFVQMTNVGLESKISAMAFDTVAGLLAIAGGSNGTGMNQLRIFGKGVSSILPLPNIDTIKYIQFKTGCPLLILIDKKNIIYTIDLKRQQILHMLPTQGIITSYCYCTGTDWMFIGFADGCIDVFDTRLGQMAKYGIPDLVASQQQQQQQQEQQQERRHESGNIVVALEMHPNNINWLLIGYESTVFLWDIRENMIHSTYELKNSDVRLSSLVWNPQGDHFMAGYDDGYLHLWAINSEHRPVLSRQVFPSLDKSQPCEPVYKLAWYFDDNAQKSYLVVCGGSAIKDIHGLHVLEFSLNHLSDVRKQSIIPSDMELMDFSLLWSEPYQPRNPLGIMLLGCNGAISAHGLDHGYPTLTLPPSLSMVHPFVSNACFIPMVDEQLYRKMTTLTDADLQTRYLPLTGGVVGPGHIYKIPSNDILLTMHAGEIIQFWDASYTSLRPLSQLVIRCHDDLDDPTVYVCCIDLNAVSGTLCVGFNDGTILTYEIVDNLPSKNQDQEEYSKMENTNAQFISQCDETINELAEILGDMQRSTPTMDESREEQQTEIIRNTNNNDGNSDTDAALSNATNINCDNDTLQQESSACNDSTNPFVSVQGVAQEPAQVTSQNAYEPESDMISNHSDNIGNKVDDQDIRDLEVQIVALKRSTKDFGYSPDVKIKLDGAIHSIVSAGTDIIACLTALGQIFIINTTIQKLYHTIDIKGKTRKKEKGEEKNNSKNF